MERLFKRVLLKNVIFSGVIVVIIINWVKPGYTISNAEEGLPFYNPNRTFHVLNNYWLDKSLGNASPYYQARIPLYLLSKALYVLGLEGWIIQAFLFGFLIATPLVFIPKLISIFVGEKKSLIIGISKI